MYRVIVLLWMETSAVFDNFFCFFLALTQSWFLKDARLSENKKWISDPQHGTQQSNASYNKDIKSEFQAKNSGDDIWGSSLNQLTLIN